jgi:hypothetical protein
MKMFIQGLISRNEETEGDHGSYITDVDHRGSGQDCMFRPYPHISIYIRVFIIWPRPKSSNLTKCVPRKLAQGSRQRDTVGVAHDVIEIGLDSTCSCLYLHHL